MTISKVLPLLFLAMLSRAVCMSAEVGTSIGGVWDQALTDPAVLEGPKERLRHDISAARESLGEKFPGVVLEYSQRNAGLAYWLGAVLMEAADGAGGLVLPVSVLQAGILRWDGVEAEEYNVFRILVVLAVCYERMGSDSMANEACRRVRAMLKGSPILDGSFPILTDRNREAYELVEARVDASD